jgi:hypothetical protein
MSVWAISRGVRDGVAVVDLGSSAECSGIRPHRKSGTIYTLSLFSPEQGGCVTINKVISRTSKDCVGITIPVQWEVVSLPFIAIRRPLQSFCSCRGFLRKSQRTGSKLTLSIKKLLR